MTRQHIYSAEAGPEEAHLRLLSTTDLHMRIMPYDYIAGCPVTGQGLALAAAEIDKARSEAANAMVFDVGDAFEGGPVDEDLAAALPAEGHPMANALNAIHLDAATLGNHDFNHGLPALERVLPALRFPIVLANVVRALGDTPQTDTPFLPPTALLDRQIIMGDGRSARLRVGVLGVTPPQTLRWDGDKLRPHLVVRDIVETARFWVADLRKNGADLVVVLCHSGIGRSKAFDMMEHAAVPVAALAGVDVVLAGHAHGFFPDPAFSSVPEALGDPDAVPRPGGRVDPVAGTLNGKPAVMPGFWGNRIGVVDFKLKYDAETGWSVSDHSTALRSIAAKTPNPAVVSAVASHHRATTEAIGLPVGQSRYRLSTYFAQVADCPALQIINAAQVAAVQAAVAGTDYAGLPVLSAAAPLKGGGRQGPQNYTDISAGRLSRRDIADLYPYQNTLAALPVTGAELRDWLERSACAFNTIRQGTRGGDLFAPAHPSYSFDVVSGVTYRFDLTQPPMFDAVGHRIGEPSRVVDLRYQGRPVSPEDVFILATNSYRLGHGSEFPQPSASPIALDPPVPVRHIVTQYLARGGAERTLPPSGWGFVPLSNTRVLFSTSCAVRAGSEPGYASPGGAPIIRHATDDDAWAVFEFDLSRAEVLGPFDES